MDTCYGRRDYLSCVESVMHGIVQNFASYQRVLQAKQTQSFAVLRRLLGEIANLPGNKTIIMISAGIDPMPAPSRKGQAVPSTNWQKAPG